MDEDELKAAYDRFHELDAEVDAAELMKLDLVCHALSAALASKQSDRPHIMPNRIAAMLAIEAVEAWEKAEWSRP